MPADRLLGTLLRSLQPYSEQQGQDVNRLLGTAASLLTSLNNPLNVVLLTSQILSAPAIWAKPDLQTSAKCISVFRSAAQALVKHEIARKSKSPDRDFAALQPERILPRDEWIRAVVKGADEHSPRWRHILVLGGILIGFGPREEAVLTRAMRSTVEKSFINAVNLACEETSEEESLGQQTIAAVLKDAFPLLSHYEQSRLHFDRVLPVLMRASFRAQAGLASPKLINLIDQDVLLTPNNKLSWPKQSPSYQHVQTLMANPLIASLGPLATLIGYCVEQVRDPGTIMGVLDDLDDYTRILHQQWRRNKLSSIDQADEIAVLDQETLLITLASLRKIYRGILFAITAILRSIIGRLLGDKTLARNTVAPDVAIQTLRILRHTYFTSGQASQSTVARFVHMTAIDILAAHAIPTRDFLYSIKPSDIGRIPQHPMERNLDLFFLNTAEFFTPVVDTATAETLFVPAATAYITASNESNLLPIFEAAHSVMLAAFAAPHNADLANHHLPFYVGALFDVFPSSLPARQFRVAYMALMQTATPPSRLAAKQPQLSSTLLELLHERAERASTIPLPPHILQSMNNESTTVLSEQAVLVLTLIDTLTQLPLGVLDEWLPITADTINMIDNTNMREDCKQHFWHTLIDGGMDPERSRVCHAWWSTAGGRDIVLYGREPVTPAALMSGALPEDPAKL